MLSIISWRYVTSTLRLLFVLDWSKSTEETIAAFLKQQDHRQKVAIEMRLDFLLTLASEEKPGLKRMVNRKEL